jgi:hypothetical protein
MYVIYSLSRRRNRSDDRNNFKVLGLPNDYFLTVMKQVRVKWPNAQYHILSQANATTVSFRSSSECTNAENVVQGFEDLREISATDVLLDLDIPEDFHAMVSADVLIDSPSSFCFSAALLSYGEVWHHAFWHNSPLDRWISCLWVDGEERYNNLDPCEKHY